MESAPTNVPAEGYTTRRAHASNSGQTPLESVLPVAFLSHGEKLDAEGRQSFASESTGY